jgi:hypothetical protein
MKMKKSNMFGFGIALSVAVGLILGGCGDSAATDAAKDSANTAATKATEAAGAAKDAAGAAMNAAGDKMGAAAGAATDATKAAAGAATIALGEAACVRGSWRRHGDGAQAYHEENCGRGRMSLERTKKEWG